MFKFLKDERGFTNLIIGVVGLVIAIILYTTVVLPIVLLTNKSGWDAASIAMYGVLPIALIGSLIAMVLGSK